MGACGMAPDSSHVTYSTALRGNSALNSEHSCASTLFGARTSVGRLRRRIADIQSLRPRRAFEHHPSLAAPPFCSATTACSCSALGAYGATSSKSRDGVSTERSGTAARLTPPRDRRGVARRRRRRRQCHPRQRGAHVEANSRSAAAAAAVAAVADASLVRRAAIAAGDVSEGLRALRTAASTIRRVARSRAIDAPPTTARRGRLARMARRRAARSGRTGAAPTMDPEPRARVGVPGRGAGSWAAAPLPPAAAAAPPHAGAASRARRRAAASSGPIPETVLSCASVARRRSARVEAREERRAPRRAEPTHAEQARASRSPASSEVAVSEQRRAMRFVARASEDEECRPRRRPRAAAAARRRPRRTPPRL